MNDPYQGRYNDDSQPRQTSEPWRSAAARPKHTGRKVLVGIIIGLAMLFAAIALVAILAPASATNTGTPQIGKATATSAQAAPAGPHAFALGEIRTFTEADNSSGTMTALSAAVAKSQFGDYDFVVTVAITCTNGAVKYNEWNWKFVDAGGTPHQMDITSPTIGSGTLAKGQTIKGTISFSDGDSHILKGGRVEYGDSLGSTDAFWSIR